MAPPTGSEPGSLGHFRLNEKKNLPGVRAARRAGRPAVDPRRSDRINERAVHARIVQSDGREASLSRERGDGGQ